jgi:hypothetical protein
MTLVACAAVLAAGCGGGGSKDIRALSVGEWASTYCSATTDWFTMLYDARDSVGSGDAAPRDAAKVMTFRTDSYVDQIEKLGRPDTADGESTAAAARDMATSLKERIGKAAESIGSDAAGVTRAQRAKVVQSQIDASLALMIATTEKLRRDDPPMGVAMKSSDDCDRLQEELGNHL